MALSARGGRTVAGAMPTTLARRTLGSPPFPSPSVSTFPFAVPSLPTVRVDCGARPRRRPRRCPEVERWEWGLGERRGARGCFLSLFPRQATVPRHVRSWRADFRPAATRRCCCGVRQRLVRPAPAPCGLLRRPRRIDPPRGRAALHECALAQTRPCSCTSKHSDACLRTATRTWTPSDQGGAWSVLPDSAKGAHFLLVSERGRIELVSFCCVDRLGFLHRLRAPRSLIGSRFVFSCLLCSK